MAEEENIRNEKKSTKPSKFSFITNRLKLGRKKDEKPTKTTGNKKGWVDSEDKGQNKDIETTEHGMVTVLLQTNG